jgi:hypothetical protein
MRHNKTSRARECVYLSSYINLFKHASIGYNGFLTPNNIGCPLSLSRTAYDPAYVKSKIYLLVYTASSFLKPKCTLAIISTSLMYFHLLQYRLIHAMIPESKCSSGIIYTRSIFCLSFVVLSAILHQSSIHPPSILHLFILHIHIHPSPIVCPSSVCQSSTHT